MKFQFHNLAAILILFSSDSPSAEISWTVHDITGDVTEVRTNGTLVADGARNGDPKEEIVVNGVLFENIANSGNLFDKVFRIDNIRDRAWGTVVTDMKYKMFLSRGQRGMGDGVNRCTTITFTNLVPSHTYQIQIWVSDVNADGVAGDVAMVLGDGLGGPPLFGKHAHLLCEVADGGAGQYAIGNFVADATTQTLNFQKWDKLKSTPTARADGHWTNGWQLRDLGPGAGTPAATLPVDSAKAGQAGDYDRWRAAHYPGIGQPEADDDGDGLSNAQEHLFGLNPKDSKSANPYAGPFDTTTGTFRYSRRSAKLTGMNYIIEYSTDGKDWREDKAARQEHATVANDVESVVVRVDPKVLGEAELFVRVTAMP